MKTINQIESDIKLLGDILNKASTKGQCNAAKRKIKIRKQCILYLETKPKEEFVNKQMEDVEFKIKTINNRFFDWCKNHNKPIADRKSKSTWNGMNNMSMLKAQLVVLKYLLN